MQKKYEVLLEALHFSLVGEKYHLDLTGDGIFFSILQMAEKQKVLPLIVDCIFETVNEQIKNPVFDRFKEKAIQEVVSQCVRTAQFKDLYTHLIASGLKPVVVKGLVLRALYPREILRPSVDEDLLVDEIDFEIYHNAMLDYGMKLVHPEIHIEEDTDLEYIHPSTGMVIELHKQLIPERSDVYGNLNRFFVNMETEWFQYNGQRFLTINPTDHLFFLLCHSYKHFLHGGFEIRQVCDLALFSEYNAERIDWKRIYLQCREASIDIFAWTLFEIGDRYLLRHKKDIAGLYEQQNNRDVFKPDIEPLLIDILESSSNGDEGMKRLHSVNYTMQALRRGQSEQNTTPIHEATSLSSVFLPYKIMKGRYHYLNRFPFLLPVAWGQRVAAYIVRLFSTKEKVSHAIESVNIGNHRVELMEYYGIIKTDKQNKDILGDKNESKV